MLSKLDAEPTSAAAALAAQHPRRLVDERRNPGALMRYLTVDGMFSGTGIRDSYERCYLDPSELGLSSDLVSRLSAWLREYEGAHYAGYRNSDQVARLDQEGQAISVAVREQLPDAKVEYYSAALTKRFLV